MPGAGHGEKLRDPLQQAHKRGGEIFHETTSWLDINIQSYITTQQEIMPAFSFRGGKHRDSKTNCAVQ
jgi:hypothetical protein